MIFLFCCNLFVFTAVTTYGDSVCIFISEDGMHFLKLCSAVWGDRAFARAAVAVAVLEGAGVFLVARVARRAAEHAGAI